MLNYDKVFEIDEDIYNSAFDEITAEEALARYRGTFESIPDFV